MRAWIQKLVIVAFLLVPTPVLSAEYFLISELGTSAEMIALGNIEGFSKSSNSLFENTAALYRIRNYSASFFTSKLFNEVNYTTFSAAYNTKYGVVGMGYMTQAVTDIPHTAAPGSDGMPTVIKLFNSDRNIFKLGYQYSLSRYLHLGAALSRHSNSLHTTKGVGYGVDLGSIYKFKKFTFSAQLKNVRLKHVSYSQSDDSSYSQVETLPRHIVLGGQYRWRTVRALMQYTFTKHHTLNAIGVRYNPPFLKMLSLMFGIKEQPYLFDKKRTTTLGTMLSLYGVNFAYSFQKSDHVEFDNYSYFSIHLTL